MDFIYHVIVFEDGDAWFAQILEVDICIQSDRREDLKSEFCHAIMERIVAAKQEGIDEDPFDLPPAPEPHPEGKRFRVEFRVDKESIHFADGSSWRTV